MSKSTLKKATAFLLLIAILMSFFTMQTSIAQAKVPEIVAEEDNGTEAIGSSEVDLGSDSDARMNSPVSAPKASGSNVTISFDLVGGTWNPEYGDQSTSVSAGSTYVLPSRDSASKEGYALRGWKDASNIEYGHGQPVEVYKNMTFTAVWAEPVTVSYNLAGGAWEYSDNTEILARGERCRLPAPSFVFKEGYMLRAWKDSSNEEHQPFTLVAVYEDMTFTAVWAEPVTVSFDLAGGTWDPEYGDQTKVLVTGNRYKLPDRENASKEGYALSGWRDASYREYRLGGFVTVNEDMTFTAIWTDPVTVSFDLAGGSWHPDYGDQTKQLAPGASYQLPEDWKVSKEGYALRGWKTSTHNCEYSPKSWLYVDEDLIFTAIWAEPVTVSFDLAGGVWNPEYGDQTKTLAQGNSFRLPERKRVFKQGYLLSRWKDDSNHEHPLDWEIKVNEDMTLTAVWAEPVTVSFNLAGGTWDSYYRDQREILARGDRYGLPSRGCASKEGYVLRGWKDVNNEEYSIYSNITVNEDMMFTAVWVEPVTVSYDLGGGVWDPLYGDQTEYLAPGELCYLPGKYFASKEGYTLHGWRDSSNKEYLPNGYVTVYEDMMFTAVWNQELSVAVFRAGWSDTYDLGQTINLAARGEGGYAPYKYKFYAIRSSGNRVNFSNDYVSSNTYSWTPQTPDVYVIGVDVVDSQGYYTHEEKAVTVMPREPLSIAVFRAGWSDTYELGQKINLAARGEGGAGSYRYQFYVIRSNGNRVNFRKNPVASNIYPWTPVTPDTYILGVDVYDAMGNKVTKEKTITVKAPSPLSIAVFRAGWSDTYKIGQKIDLAARGEGGTAPYKYQFYVLRSNGNRVNFRRTPVSSNIYPWTPVTPDTYTLGVDVYDTAGKKVTEEKMITVLPAQ